MVICECDREVELYEIGEDGGIDSTSPSLSLSCVGGESNFRVRGRQFHYTSIQSTSQCVWEREEEEKKKTDVNGCRLWYTHKYIKVCISIHVYTGCKYHVYIYI